jgi:ubiquinone/menaquinone biosynthesis C-methylase UbiE
MTGDAGFNAATARVLERMYSAPEVVAQRNQVLRAMALREGEVVLDVGSGPGMLAKEMAEVVGSSGVVSGIDMSEPMIALCRQRCAEEEWTDFRVGEATALPFEDGVFDVAAAVQVYEYVPDVALALSELFRVVRPGGRAFVLDTDWDSLVWSTSDRPRMKRILEAWNEHLSDPYLPEVLTQKLRDTGFQVIRREVMPMFNPEYHAHSYSAGIAFGIESFVPGRRGLTREEVADWAADLQILGARGEYFFSVNRYLFVVVKPGRPDDI